jgi:shikimate dehydrogenase
LGSGGSSKAVKAALQKLEIPYETVSRGDGHGNLTYESLKQDGSALERANLIINTTPLGMTPDTESFPPIPYDKLTSEHYVYDLIYNPARTMFLQKSEMKGALIKNGLEMLHEQAEKSWSIWSS